MGELRSEVGRIVEANGTKLYHEVRGDGPPVLFIAGATGDAGHFADVADELSDEFKVITYDRRGNSRSARPPGWVRTSIAEQADDAAALLDALSVKSAVAFGTSGGGTILLELISRHPESVRGAIAHEPMLVGVSPTAPELSPRLHLMSQEAFAAGGRRGAQERFLRWACTDEVYEAIDGDLRERLLGNGEVFFGLELPHLLSYLPDADAIRRAGVTIIAAAGIDNKGTFMAEGVEWLKHHIACDAVWMRGHHAPYLHPEQARGFANAVRPWLKQLAG